MSPIPQAVQVPQLDVRHQPERDLGDSTRDLPRDEVLSSARALVVEKEPVAGEHAVGFAVVDHYPVAVEFGARWVGEYGNVY